MKANTWNINPGWSMTSGGLLPGLSTDDIRIGVSQPRNKKLAEYGEMTEEDLQELLNVKKTRAYLLTRQMNENGLIEIVGRGAAKKYRLH